jgi:L,D-transpeptidase YcbB
LRAADYIEAIVVNLERYRWHQSRLIDRSVRINIPTATLTLTDCEKVEIQMKVIIGRVDRRTPVLSSVLNMITINPTWTIPPTILKEDVLPAIAVDPGYLARHNIRVINRKGVEVYPDSVQWSTLNAARFPYTLREDPGPHNPLGLIKFSFPNEYSVYLHDTNMPSLFSNQDRTLSSGCIRIESPMGLARVLLEGSGWTEEMVRDEILKGETRMVLLKKTLPVHITYFTAYVNHSDLIVARDVYKYDRIVMNALLGSGKSRL